MTHKPLVCLLLLLAVQTAPVRAADESTLLRLATCQDSWLDWKDDEARRTRFGEYLTQRYTSDHKTAAWTPKSATTLLGHPVSQVFPQSVGMGLGFSVVVEAPFEQARRSFEAQLGRPLKCSTSDGMKACELSLAEKKTAMLMSSDQPGAKTSLLGCYYYYEK